MNRTRVAATRLQTLVSSFAATPSNTAIPKRNQLSSLASPSRSKSSSSMEASRSPLSGLYKPNNLQGLYYGPDVVQKHLLSCLPSSNSKAFIITGNTLATKTPLIENLEKLLSSSSSSSPSDNNEEGGEEAKNHHAGTFSNIKEHAPIAQLDEATSKVLSDPTIDTIISVGGGSPIDSAKAISHRVNEKSGSFLRHIAIPTTLSAAECTFTAGYTQSNGVKTGVANPGMFPSFIFYDPKFAVHTPPALFVSTGIRALDHAVELQYHPTATLVPCQYQAQIAIRALFEHLPKYKSDPKDEDVITGLFLAAYASLAFLGANIKGGLGLSHSLGYALGSPYGIPHGVTSCLTLGHVVKLKAEASPDDARAIADLLTLVPGGGAERSGNDVEDARKFGDKILDLVERLGFKTSLTEKGVGKDQVDIIVERATGGLSKKEGKSAKEEKLVGAVRKLVEGLY